MHPACAVADGPAPTDTAARTGTYEAAAQRRHVTVIFCDLVDSTRHSGGTDPEDWREAMAAYRSEVTAAIERYGGHVAQFQGDALVSYLGFPFAREDDASRAVHAGLAILEALKEVNRRTSALGIPELAVRIGIHSGPAVIARVAYETEVAGVTTHVAARIQALAEPNTVVVSENVRVLTAGEFVTSELGTFEMKGVDEPPCLHVVVATSGVRSRLKGVERLTPFVGRRRELEVLTAAWERVKAGSGGALLVVGEAGIGKSRLVLTLHERLAGESYTWLECTGSPYTTHAAFAPIVELVQQGLDISDDDDDESRLAKIRQRAANDGLDAEVLISALAPMLGIESDHAGAASDIDARTRTIETLVQWGVTLGERQPVLLLFEDLHWCDPSTLEFLRRFIPQAASSRVLVLMTSRPGAELPLQDLAPEAVVTLARLPKATARRMLRLGYDPSTFSRQTADAILDRADGIPLYVEELAKMMADAARRDGSTSDAENGRRVARAGRGAPPIPETLQDLLTARLDSLGDAKEVAQLASVIGREVPLRLLECISPVPVAALSASLERLVEAEILFARGTGARTTFLFKHALIQDAAYHSLLKATRRHHHGRVADELVSGFPDVLATQPELIAQHYTEAQRAPEAVAMWIRAGRHAVECSAHVEAIAHAEAGLALIHDLPDEQQRLQSELALQLVLGPSLMASRGYADPAMERAYTRAQELCRKLGNPPELYPVMFGLWTFHCVRARHDEAGEIARDMTRLAEREASEAMLLEADVCAGITHFYVADFGSACSRLERVSRLHDPQRDADHPLIYGQDPRAAALAHLMLARWTLGDVEGALVSANDSVALARSTNHPFSAAYVLAFGAWLHRLRGDAAACLALAQDAIDIGGKRAVSVFLAIAEILKGAAMVSVGQQAAGLKQLHLGLDRFDATASTLITPFWCCLRAQAYAEVGRLDEAMAFVEESLRRVERAGERQAEAEIYRTRGWLRQLRGEGPAEIESDLRRAIDIAEAQHAASWKLRAAIPLSRLLLRTERLREAATLLVDARKPFPVASAEPDVVTADALLTQLLS
ncbi:MAG TPA: AAA family ATPase [Candidatus Limnocylindrales bacterium]|nr:AAA family ATPase [Candidatus Limnocylindrales bacterium]